MTMPVPMPVETLTRHSDRTWEKPAAYSPMAAASASLATRTGTPGRPRLEVLGHRIGVPARQDGRLAGPAGVGVDGAREAETHAAEVVGGEVVLADQDGQCGTRCGPAPRWDRRRRGRRCGPRASTVPPRSVTAIRVCVVSTAATRTRDCEVLKASRRRRRPPVASVVSPSTIIAAPSSASSRWATVIRDSPVASRTSPRVDARPWRIRSRMSPGPVGTDGHPLAPVSGRVTEVDGRSITTGHVMLDN